MEGAIDAGRRTTQKVDADLGQVAEVDGVAAAGATDGDRDVFGAFGGSCGIPQPEHA